MGGSFKKSHLKARRGYIFFKFPTRWFIFCILINYNYVEISSVYQNRSGYIIRDDVHTNKQTSFLVSRGPSKGRTE